MEYKILYFKEMEDWVPYPVNDQPLCDVIEEAYGKQVYNQMNPGEGADHTYKIVFTDGEVIHVIVCNKLEEVPTYKLKWVSLSQ
jgi:hypothetical protein